VDVEACVSATFLLARQAACGRRQIDGAHVRFMSFITFTAFMISGGT
jgi:hypothetical protein